MKSKKIFILFLLLNISLISYAQRKFYVSNKNTVTIANGNYCQVEKIKSIYFDIYILGSSATPNKKGEINLQDTPFNTKGNSNRKYYDTFRVYQIKLNENGVYEYWTVDIAQDGQTVLFEVDLNSAIPKITMSRYSRSSSNNVRVLKRIIYSLE